jgi:PhnB protein
VRFGSSSVLPGILGPSPSATSRLGWNTVEIAKTGPLEGKIATKFARDAGVRRARIGAQLDRTFRERAIIMTDGTAHNTFQTSVTATLSVRKWEEAIEFYKTAFGATELYRVAGGGVGQLAVKGADFWVAEESPAHLNFSPESLGGCSVRLLLMVEDPAAVYAQAVSAGATAIVPVADSHGWRLGRLVDPFGHHWEIGRPIG